MNMKNLKKITMVFILILSFMGVVAQSPQASAVAQVNARIIEPITLTKIVDMNFGNIISSATPGTVILAVDNTRISTGGAFLPTSTPGVITSAKFETTGYAGATYNISLPQGNSVSIDNTNNGTGPENKMFLNNFISLPVDGLLNSSGTQEFTVGSTLEVKANQNAGLYSGSFIVRVNYN